MRSDPIRIRCAGSDPVRIRIRDPKDFVPRKQSDNVFLLHQFNGTQRQILAKKDVHTTKYENVERFELGTCKFADCSSRGRTTCTFGVLSQNKFKYFMLIDFRHLESTPEPSLPTAYKSTTEDMATEAYTERMKDLPTSTTVYSDEDLATNDDVTLEQSGTAMEFHPYHVTTDESYSETETSTEGVTEKNQAQERQVTMTP
ncbi:hypothetical protein L596_028842 [Steinernema carpocapsae]|uniref:Uncharacterized protein n=1 Tax=Steinernema carpocapsae TaxID=34508 RepID=A0A4U5LZM1_STECR|nr:hypothetical protein L596_028842 [Steinernema carpocapsae]